MIYEPKPIDTSDIELSADLEQVVEDISRNIHDVWALRRISEGWVYGSEKDGSKKTTPYLVDYSQLPEHEKDTDRSTVTETVKMLLKLGYKIEKEK